MSKVSPQGIEWGKFSAMPAVREDPDGTGWKVSYRVYATLLGTVMVTRVNKGGGVESRRLPRTWEVMFCG